MRNILVGALALLFLLVVGFVLVSCVTVDPPEQPSLIMYCQVCERLTSWVEYCEEYIQCTVSGTRW